MAKAIAAFGVWWLCCLQADAQDARFHVCESESMVTSSHFYNHGWEDLGGGYLAFFEHSFGDSGTSENLLIQDCKSGAEYRSSDLSTQQLRQVHILIEEVKRPETRFNVDTVAKRLNEISVEMSQPERASATHESCACNVAYPRLRGVKVRWKLSEYARKQIEWAEQLETAIGN